MLHSANAVKGYKLAGIDGEIGRVKEFYFDDRHWTIRYLVADTGSWLPGRQVLISPYALGAVDTDIYKDQVAVNLTRKQIEGSPSLESDRPVSRQFEEDYHSYYGWPMYWAGPYTWGYQRQLVRDRVKRTEAAEGKKTWSPHLRSSREVSGYHIQATDGEIGHVEDFIIDDDTWTIRYLLVNTHNWWPGKKVLVSPRWIGRVSWGESKVFVNLTRDTIRLSPEYTNEFLLTRDYEDALHQHYSRRGYWVNELVTA